MSKRFWAWALPLAIFVGILFFLWMGLQRDPRMIPSPLHNKPAPAFQATSLWDAGKIITERDFQGHVTVLNVFASWCVACSAEHTVWMEARHDVQNTGVQFIGLNYKDDREKALQWLKQYGDPYDQVVSDSSGNIGIDYGVYGTPETFIIDKKGIIRYKFIGAVSPGDWRKILLPEIEKC